MHLIIVRKGSNMRGKFNLCEDANVGVLFTKPYAKKWY